MGDNQRGALYRPIVPNQHSRVTYAELFFDLVFVFAVTQISHTLLGRFTPLLSAHSSRADFVLRLQLNALLFEAAMVDPDLMP